jgi:beta-lactamase regulating signal transducer with metallopeptidase domain
MTGGLLIDLYPYIRAITSILIHSLWQGFLIGLIAAIMLSLLRSSRANIRYVVSCSAMAAVIVATVITAVAIWPDATGAARHTPTVTDQQASREGNRTDYVAVEASTVNNETPPVYPWWSDPSVSLYVFVIWIAGVLLFSVYHLVGWRRARGFIRRGTSPVPCEWQARFEKLCLELRLGRLVSLLSSSMVKVPCVVGWIKPVILVPLSMFTSLDPGEIEMILVHELAHVRRYDVLISIVQTALETLFFFNPAIWWISRRIRVEREDCCDDAAIIRTGDRLKYARALTNLEELRMFQTSFGSALTGAPLKRRIQRIVGIPRAPFYSAIPGLTGMLLFAFLIVVVLGPVGISNDSALQASENTLSAQTFQPEPGDLRGEWETEMDGDQMKVLVYGRESSGMSYILAPDQVADLMGQRQEPFQIVRDAGTLFLEGRLKEHNGEVDGSGKWYFRPDTSYMRFMSRYGLREDDRQKTFSLAIRDISRKYLTQMDDRGYHDLSVDQLISAGVFGISPELVDEYRSLGYHDLTYQQLLSMQVQHVTPDDARRFEKVGMGHLTPEQLVSARIQGLTPEYIESFRKAGFRDLVFKNFITLRAFNLSVDDFEDCYRHRFMDLSQENMVWVCGFGITRDDIERMKDRGYTDMDSIISMLAKEYGSR